MYRLAVIALFLVSLASAQTTPTNTSDSKVNEEISKCYTLFNEGKYQATWDTLVALEKSKKFDKGIAGLIAYWKGLAANRLQEYPDAITHFEQAIKLDYRPKDIYYEYGQALYAQDALPEARVAFRESLKRQFKRSVSLYYIAFISQTLGDHKKAVTFYKAIEKLPAEEADEVRQAARMQIGDVYLEQSERHPDAFRAIETYVIPQYRQAMEVNPGSPLGKQIAQKIVSLQQKYELVLFQMRNGRPTQIPPYFLRIAYDLSLDDNVTFTPQETTISSSDKSSMVSKIDMMGRYSLYYKNVMSFAPELRINRAYHHNRVENVYRNDNYAITPALRMAHEHHIKGKPASLLADVDFSYTERDVNGEEKLEYNSRSYSMMLGEKFQLFSFGDSILRFRHRIYQNFLSASNSRTNSVSWEQVANFSSGHFLLMNAGYDMTKVEDELYDTNAVSLRADLIFPVFKEHYTPSIGFGYTMTDPVNNKDKRGTETLLNPSVKLSRAFGRQWRLNGRAEYFKNESKDKQNFAYTKTVYGLELEYLY